MSQDTGLFSARRRETQGSAIPVPTSAMKPSSSQNRQSGVPQTTHHVRTSASRMSLAPGRPAQPNFHRSSSSGNLADAPFSAGPRRSTVDFMRASRRTSNAHGASTPAQQTQRESVQRRSSVYSARPSMGLGSVGRQSFFANAPPSSGIPSDPRRLRDPNTRAAMAEELTEFLAVRNFELVMKYTLSPKCMTSPTQKDFNMMFQFLYLQLDPHYRFQKSTEAEVPPLLKHCHYPFERNISKSQLAAVGGNNWPTFLGLLHWLMVLAKMMERYAQGDYDAASVQAGFNVRIERIVTRFLFNSYREWLNIEDENDDEEEAKRRIEPHVEQMKAEIEEEDKADLEEFRALEAESQRLASEIAQLSKSGSQLSKLDELITVLEQDRVKFDTYNTSMQAKVDKYEQRVSLLQQELDRCERELLEAEADRTSLQQQLDQKGLSVAEIDRMVAERERLEKGSEILSSRRQECHARMKAKEAEASSKLEDLDSAVQQFNRAAYLIKLIPSTAIHAHGKDYELRLATRDHMGDESRLSGWQAESLLPSTDLTSLAQTLTDLRKSISDRRAVAQEENIARIEQLKTTTETLEYKQRDMDALNHRYRAAEDEHERIREVTSTQTMTSEAQIERMEKELAKIRTSMMESVQLMEQREISTTVEYDHLVYEAAAVREELHTEIERMLNEIIRFKIHCQRSLEEFEEFIAQELEVAAEEGGRGEG